ncbi:hydroxycarboxylic acid receptor 3-like [Pleurodeles waltl]|uniref:hydroxycarboxylic acid receptor 3-like n=1 Tax=Pleurodeles waltl TaxID=8319 RepID=UPI0037098F97
MNLNASCLFVETQQSVALAAVLLAEFGIGLLGNGVALWIFCFRITSWKPSTIYLFNLSLADFLLIFCLPFRAHYFLKGNNWYFGDIPCRIMLFMVSLNRGGSIFFLTVVAVDRYFKVVHPFHKINSTTKKKAIGFAVVIWVLLMAMTVYILAETHLIDGEIANTTLCESFNLNRNFSSIQIWHNIFFMAETIVPLGIILFCTWSIVCELRSHREDRQGTMQRAVRSVTIVSFEFIVCFLPSALATFAVSLSKALNKCDAFQTACVVFVISLSFTYLNSVINPLVFYFSSPTFRSTLNSSFIPNFIRKCRNR